MCIHCYSTKQKIQNKPPYIVSSLYLNTKLVDQHTLSILILDYIYQLELVGSKILWLRAQSDIYKELFVYTSIV